MFDPDDLAKYDDQTTSSIHHALRAPRRRLTVFLLLHYFPQLRVQPPGVDKDGRTDPVPVRRLARAITCIENGVSMEEATGDAYYSVYNSLIQTHLPKLDEIGAVSFDSARKTVHPSDNLIALAIAASVSSTVGELVFYSALADSFAGGVNHHLPIDD